MCRPSVSKANLGTMSPINGSSLSSEIQTIYRCLVFLNTHQSNGFGGDYYFSLCKNLWQLYTTLEHFHSKLSGRYSHSNKIFLISCAVLL